MFLKTARSFEAKFTHMSNLPDVRVSIYLSDENQAVSKVPLGPNLLTFDKVKAAAIIPVSSMSSTPLAFHFDPSSHPSQMYTTYYSPPLPPQLSPPSLPPPPLWL